MITIILLTCLAGTDPKLCNQETAVEAISREATFLDCAFQSLAALGHDPRHGDGTYPKIICERRR